MKKCAGRKTFLYKVFVQEYELNIRYLKKNIFDPSIYLKVDFLKLQALGPLQLFVCCTWSSILTENEKNQLVIIFSLT